MALTLAYSVTGIKVKDEVNADGVTLENAVCQTYWKLTGSDENGNAGEFSGATPFSAAKVSEGAFTEFASLVETDVIGWIQAVVDGDTGYKAHILERIQLEIDTAISADVDMPWAPDVTPVPDEGAAVVDGEE
jgi:hypothetical protein